MNTLNRLGDWNPQLFREIKGKLKFRQMAIAITTSLLAQLLLVIGFYGKLPSSFDSEHHYCTGGKAEYYYVRYNCLPDTFGNPIINWQLWWTDVFLGFSVIGTLALITIGIYWLIDDLGKEERRETLNFIRLSPQSTQSLFLGKLLGVPLLLYLGILLAIPLHTVSGLLAGNPLWRIIGYDAAVLGACFFFYTGALLFGLVSSWMGGFQATFGSSLVFLVLYLPANAKVGEVFSDVLKFFSPLTLLPYLIEPKFLWSVNLFHTEADFQLKALHNWQWFNLHIGLTFLGTLSFIVVSYLVGSGWLWQLLERSFRNPHITVLSKAQSYGMSACVAILFLGYTLKGQPNVEQSYYFLSWLPYQLKNILTWYLIGGLALIGALLPQRQACIDWARCRYIQPKHRKTLWEDLLWGEKSPATLAIALNLIILHIPFVVWVMCWPTQSDRTTGILTIVVNASLIWLYACIAQLLLLMKTPKRGLWAMGSVVGAIALPPAMLLVLSIKPEEIPALWLFAPLSWSALDYASLLMVFVSAIAQGGLIGLLNLELTRQLHQAGESASKALLAPR